MTAPHEKCNECDLSESCFDCWLIHMTQQLDLFGNVISNVTELQRQIDKYRKLERELTRIYEQQSGECHAMVESLTRELNNELARC